jgi:hypothetical protein
MTGFARSYVCLLLFGGLVGERSGDRNYRTALLQAVGRVHFTFLGRLGLVASSAGGVQLETDLVRVEEVPPTEVQCPIDEDPREGLVLRRRHARD